MPNHVTNEVTFKGSPERIKALRDICRCGESAFRFQSFFPMPIELLGTSSPAKIVSPKELREWKKKLENGLISKWEEDYRPITEKESATLIKNYGANNWYDWHIQNWGTKWDCYDVISHDDTEIHFNTAWSTPIRAMIRLSELFPDVEINVRYADEDFGSNVGTYTLLNGDFEELYQPEYSKESVKLAMQILGDTEYWITDRLCEIEDEEIKGFELWLVEIAHDEGNLEENYPVPVLEKLMELAINEEQYERAGQIKNLIKMKLNSENINQ
jgi:hypothetical protein